MPAGTETWFRARDKEIFLAFRPQICALRGFQRGQSQALGARGRAPRVGFQRPVLQAFQMRSVEWL